MLSREAIQQWKRWRVTKNDKKLSEFSKIHGDLAAGS